MLKDTSVEDREIARKILEQVSVHDEMHPMGYEEWEQGENFEIRYTKKCKCEEIIHQALSSRYADGYKAGLERAKEIAKSFEENKWRGIKVFDTPRPQNLLDLIEEIQQELDGGVNR